ncbi:MAG: tryptophan-rich sensory protein [Candidatus Daviesbacteria bacterium]|nr:MAG: tryptophan-rich sensory protein [Candidatus Daviesbacteria bacterium]
MPKDILKLILSIGLCLGAGIIGSFFTVSSIPTWYATLNKPSFSPPNWIFGPVWTVLYILMGVSLYLALSGKGKGEREKAVRIFAMQLFLNIAWSVIFFGMRNPILAFVDIVFLWIAIFLTIKSFYKINKLAGNLLIPYLLWVSFASILNLAIVLLNS